MHILFKQSRAKIKNKHDGIDVKALEKKIKVTCKKLQTWKNKKKFKNATKNVHHRSM